MCVLILFDLSKKTPNLSCESMKCIPKIICQYYVLYKYTFCGTFAAPPQFD